MDASSQDPLGVFSTVDSNSDGFISIDEYETLTEGIQEITGNALSRTFADFDVDGDGKLNISELRSVLDVAGFAPHPPPPPEQVAAAYEAQSGEDPIYMAENERMLAQLLEYLDSRADDFDIVA
jgi:Ca2+-binding EF-hand superfamily protein